MATGARRSQIHVIAAPIGDHLGDLAVAALKVLEKVTHVFIESEDQAAARFRAKGVIKPHHVVRSFDDPETCVKDAVALIADGTDFAILASSGIPGFVDPGWQIFDWIYANDALDKVDLHPVGVSSALDGALALSGANLQRFVFGGHYPEYYELEDLPTLDHTFAVVHYVRGSAIRAYVDAVQTRFSPRRVLLFKDMRKRGRAQVLVRDAGAEHAPLIDDPQADYVAVVLRQR